MPTRRTNAAQAESAKAAAADTADPIQGETTYAEDDPQLAGLLDEIEDGDASVTLYRLPEGRSTVYSFLFVRNVQEVTMPEILEALRDDYGGGSFRLEVRDAKGLYLAAKKLNVEAPKRPLPGHELRDRDRDESRERRDAVPDFSPIIDMIERSNAQHRETLNTLLTAMRPPERDVGQLVESLAALDRLRPQPQAQAGMGMKDLLEAFQLFDSIRGSGDGGGGSTGWDVLRSAASSFFPMIQQGMLQSRGAHPALTFEPQAAPAGANPGAQPPPDSAPGAVSRETPAASQGSPAAADHMQQQLEVLLRAAAQDRDPWVYASLTLDELGDVAASRLFIDGQGWAAFSAQVPQAAQFAEWFAEFREAMSQLLAEQSAEQQQETAPGVRAAPSADADSQPTDGAAAGAGGRPPDPGGDGQDRGSGKARS